MQQKNSFIFILVLITPIMPIQSMNYWNSAKTASAKLYAAAAQKSEDTITALQRAGFNDMEKTKSDLLKKFTYKGFSYATQLGIPLVILSVCNRDPLFMFTSSACAMISATGLTAMVPAYNYVQLFEFLKTKRVSSVELTSLLKKWIMDQDPAIVPAEKFMALAMKILEKNHVQLYDPQLLKHLIKHGQDDAHDNNNLLLMQCCIKIRNPEHLHTLAEYLVAKKANPHIVDLSSNKNACHYLLRREHDDFGQTFKMFLEQMPITQTGLTDYLVDAAYYNKLSAVMVLVQHGAPINTACVIDRTFALSTALLRNNTAIVRYLLHYGADKEDVHPDILDNDEEIHLMWQSNEPPQLTAHLRDLEWKLLANPKMSVATHDASRTKELR